MRDVLLGALAIVLLGTSLGLAQVQLFGPELRLLKPYRPAVSAQVGFIDAKSAFELYQDGRAVFVDAREQERYQEGHIPGAIHVAPDADLSLLPYGGTLILYCDGPECGASARLAERVVKVRTSRTLLMLDGWTAWQAAGLPVAP